MPAVLDVLPRRLARVSETATTKSVVVGYELVAAPELVRCEKGLTDGEDLLGRNLCVERKAVGGHIEELVLVEDDGFSLDVLNVDIGCEAGGYEAARIGCARRVEEVIETMQPSHSDLGVLGERGRGGGRSVFNVVDGDELGEEERLSKDVAFESEGVGRRNVDEIAEMVGDILQIVKGTVQRSIDTV